MTGAEQMQPSDRPGPRTGDGTIVVAVLTHNRVHLLQKCVENVLLRTSEATRKIVIWDNASADGTAHYLASLRNPRITVVSSPENIGQNAYARIFRSRSSEYLIEVDDDVVEAPQGWDATLRDALRKLPDIGFLAADLEDDPHDVASNYRHRIRAHEYSLVEINGVRVLTGPTGGGCAITSRALYDRVGGFQEHDDQVFFLEDAAYVEDIKELGYGVAVLADLRVHHTGGPYYTESSSEKEAYWARWNRERARKDAVKRVLLRLPLIGRLNRRFDWFSPPS